MSYPSILIYTNWERDRRSSGIFLSLKEYQQTDKDNGAECEEIYDRNERHPDPKLLFRIGCFLKEVRVAVYVMLGDGITDNEKEKENQHA
jgi:hypothetical protein